MSSTPPTIAAAIFDLKGFQVLYSTLVSSPGFYMLTHFSLYTDSPGTRFLVAKASSLPLIIKTPGNHSCGSTTT